MTGRKGPETLDLLSWEPPEEIVERFDDRSIRGASIRIKISKAVRETLRECGMDREDVAARMTEWLGEDVPKSALDAYASQARDEHIISYPRLLALVAVTGDTRLLQIGAEQVEHSVVSDEYLEWVRVGQWADVKEYVDSEFDSARKQAMKRARRRRR